MSRFKRFLVNLSGIFSGIYFGNYYRAMTDEELFDRAEIVHRFAHAHEKFCFAADRLKKTMDESPWIYRKEMP